MSRAPSRTATKVRIASAGAILAILGSIIPATAAHSTTGLCGFGFYPPCDDDPVIQPTETTTTTCVGPRCQVAPPGGGVLDPGPAGTLATNPPATTTPGTVTTTKPGTATSTTRAGGTVAPGKTQTGNKTGSGGTQGETVPETVPASPAAVTDEEAQSDSGLPLFAILAIILVLAGAAFGGFRYMQSKQG